MKIEDCVKNFPIPLEKEQYMKYSNIVFFITKERQYEIIDFTSIMLLLTPENISTPVMYDIQKESCNNTITFYGNETQIDLIYKNWLKLKLSGDIDV